MGLFNKKELERIAVLEQENATLKQSLKSLNGLDYLAIQEAINTAQGRLDELSLEDLRIKQKLADMVDEIQGKKKELGIIESDIERMDFGLYCPVYNTEFAIDMAEEHWQLIADVF